MLLNLDSIRQADQRIRPAIVHSPCSHSLLLSRICGCEIYCKLDQRQITGSFKERGARNKLIQLADAERSRGVIAASAGNHALALAYHGKQLGIAVTVVMPKWAPMIKVANCRGFGAAVIQHGDTFQDAVNHAHELMSQRGMIYVHGFDDLDIIAGQGTLGLEILEDVPDVDAVIVPVGGGGLIAGVGTAIKALQPRVQVIGVEPENAPTMAESLKRGQVTRIECRPTLADGLAIAEVGKLCFEIARNVVDQLVLVDEPSIAKAVLRLLEMGKIVVEGAGASPLAGMMSKPLGLEGKKVVLLLAGGNIDAAVISHVIERGLAADGRLCRIVAQISDRPGGLAQFTAVLASTGASIKDVYHDRNFGPMDIARVRVVCILETRDFDHIAHIHHTLGENGIEFTAG